MASHLEKVRFSERLQQSLERAGYSAASPTAVARRFNILYPDDPISVQAVRRWLEGSAIPAQDKLVVLARWLRVTPEWLRYGEEARAPAGMKKERDISLRYGPESLPTLTGMLSNEHQQMVLRVVVALLAIEGKLVDAERFD